jgi:hypothetical protein
MESLGSRLPRLLQPGILLQALPAAIDSTLTRLAYIKLQLKITGMN